MLKMSNVSTGLVLAALVVVVSVSGSAASAFADSPAELLEKAIYIEETVGDLDKAIDGYEQVLSASEQAIDAAAEAQYRIGSCLAKQGRTEAATKAFQAVADIYAASENWAKRAKEQLATLNALQPEPWGDGDEMHLRMKMPGGLDAGYMVYRVAKTNVDGKDFWECQSWQTVILNNSLGKSRVLADFNSFAPIESQWKHSLLGTSNGNYLNGEATVTFVGKKSSKTLTMDPSTFDNEQAAQVFRRLPLAKDYEGKINVVSTLGQTLVPIGLEVNEMETVEVPAGTFECFKMELSIGQTFWISTSEKREIVRFEGGGVEADLVEVRNADLNSKTIGGDKFALTLPAFWHAYTPESSANTTFLIDPDNSMRSRAISMEIEAAKKKFDSPQAVLESKIGDVKKVHKNVTGEASDIKTLSVAGHDAAMIDYEFDGDKARQHVRQLLVFGNGDAVDLKFSMSADEQDTQLPRIQKLIDSLKLK